jgi:hypothetical protein
VRCALRCALRCGVWRRCDAGRCALRCDCDAAVRSPPCWTGLLHCAARPAALRSESAASAALPLLRCCCAGRSTGSSLAAGRVAGQVRPQLPALRSTSSTVASLPPPSTDTVAPLSDCTSSVWRPRLPGEVSPVATSFSAGVKGLVVVSTVLAPFVFLRKD